MSKNILVFDSAGRTVHIKFANEAESLDFEDQGEAIAAVIDCYGLGKLSAQDKDIFLQEIKDSKSLPYRMALIDTYILARISIFSLPN